MNMWIGVLPALLLAFAASGTQAQAPTTQDAVLDVACIELMNAGSTEELKQLARQHDGRNATAVAQAELDLSAAEAKARGTEAPLRAAEKAAAEAKARLSAILTSVPTAAEHAAAREKAQKELREIRALERKYQDAKADLDVFAKATLSGDQHRDELARKQRELRTRKRILDAADENAVQERLKQATDGYNEKTDGAVVLRARIDSLDAAEAVARRAHAAARRAEREAEANLAQQRMRHDAMTRCAAERSVQLDPALGPKLRQLDETLDKIERSIADHRQKAAQAAQSCAALEARIRSLQAEAADLGRAADALAAKAATPQAGAAEAQRRAADATRAVADARTAAATVARSRAHAVKAAQDTCQGSEAIVKNLDPAARGKLADVQRSRTEAEQDVAQAAAALDRIRAAFAAAQAAGSTQSPLAAELASLRERYAGLHRQREAVHKAAAEFANLNQSVAVLDGLLKPLLSNATSHFVHAAVEQLRAFRIGVLHKRVDEIDRTCLRRMAAAAAVDAALNDAAAKLNAATTAAIDAGALPHTALSVAEIETVFKAARSEADAVAAEATKAVRCEAAARNALANPPTGGCAAPLPAGAVAKPDPGRKGGLTCRYRCGSGTIAFTVFDGRTTCPAIPDGTLISATPSGPPEEMMQGFEGKWIDNPKSFWVIAGGVNNFSIKGEWHGPGGPEHTNLWNGTCERTGPRAAKCRGNGVYNDSDKRVSFTLALNLRVSGKSLDYDSEYMGVNIAMKKPGMAPYGAIQNGAKHRGSLRRE